MIRFLFTLLKLGRCRQLDIPEYRSSLYGFGVLLPHCICQHLHHHCAERFVFRFGDNIEQGAQTQACGPSANLWQLELGVAVRIVQFEHNFVTIRNVRREVTVARFDAGCVEVSRDNLTQWIRF